ncbi:hypothetical protein SAMN04487989_10267 [Bizionia echini]|uniref:Uncharacterized protein n=1 Tax=Bizionia echini TaxID=649333 RepID=A0A1I5AI65_9FLAO|nr:hypothetical protein [Bizionia echini]SFN62060.1 hypothetical protein SAMN04487989_10267 [Bizionia echini]
MRNHFLLPHKYKAFGWVLLIIGLISGILLYATDFEPDMLKTSVLSIYNGDSLFSGTDKGWFKIIENGIIDELSALAIIIGGLLVGFTREKVEDEFIYQLRTESLVWAIIVNYIILALAVIFVYDMVFFNVMIFNMFTPLFIFIIRFNFLKLKSNSHDE